VTDGVGVSPDGDLFLNFVDQFEVGLRFKTGIGNWSVVYFDAQVAEAAQFEVTTQQTIQNEFDTNGVEIEADFAWENGFGISGNVQDDNAFDLPAYTTVGAYVNYEVYDGLTVSLNANNLLDEEGFTEGEEGAPSIGEFVRFRPINGRTISATVRYDF